MKFLKSFAQKFINLRLRIQNTWQYKESLYFLNTEVREAYDRWKLLIQAYLFYKFISKCLWDPYLQYRVFPMRTPQFMSIRNNRHPLVPPIPTPYPSQKNKKQTREHLRFMTDVWETILYNSPKMKLIETDHPSRENSSLIDDMLLYDHEPSKYIEEAMFEANELALKKNAYDPNRNMKKEFDENNIKCDMSRLKAKVFPA